MLPYNLLLDLVISVLDVSKCNSICTHPFFLPIQIYYNIFIIINKYL